MWGNHEENLVAVERYIYFPASRRQFGSKSKALLEMRRDETPQSGMLMTALSVLLRTHARMFRVLTDSGGVEAAGCKSGERPAWDVRQMLQDERTQVTTNAITNAMLVSQYCCWVTLGHNGESGPTIY